jgi:hypothetical protein
MIDKISATTPLRLAVAAEIAYPDGSMTATGLRREAARGKLAIERVAGKDYTTLAAIDEMRTLCRVKLKAHVSGSSQESPQPKREPRGKLSGSSKTERGGLALDAARMTAERLKKGSQLTS